LDVEHLISVPLGPMTLKRKQRAESCMKYPLPTMKTT